MLEARLLDDRLVLAWRRGEVPFWTGGPGEEAFNACLGAQLRVGRGVDFDYLWPHYRSSAVGLAAGLATRDFLRQAFGRATDPFSAGRNFVNHFCDVERNLGPVSSPVSSQFVFALGTARAQRGRGSLTVCIGGDASTQSGDFASLLVWSTRPKAPLPILIVVTNNQVGISTRFDTVHGERSILDRARAFGIGCSSVDGVDIDASYAAIAEAMAHVRATGRPWLLEARVSRLWGHSSSSYQRRDAGPDEDPLARIEAEARPMVAEVTSRLDAEEAEVRAEAAVDGASARWGTFFEGRATVSDGGAG